MPNLNLIASLREKYDSNKVKNFSEFENKKRIDESIKFLLSEKLRSSIDPSKLLLEFKSFSQPSTKPEVIRYFESNKKENVTLLFIDITNFSTKFADRTTIEIKRILDKFYADAFPIIYKHSGEIEKIIGDGIIAVFGKPFSESNQNVLFSKSINCSKELIKKFKNTELEVKVALHTGEVMYYKTGSEFYEEYTMIGNTLTELFRLESISTNNALNSFKFERVEEYIHFFVAFFKEPGWTINSINVNLKGIGSKIVNQYILG